MATAVAVLFAWIACVGGMDFIAITLRDHNERREVR